MPFEGNIGHSHPPLHTPPYHHMEMQDINMSPQQHVLLRHSMEDPLGMPTIPHMQHNQPISSGISPIVSSHSYFDPMGMHSGKNCDASPILHSKTSGHPWANRSGGVGVANTSRGEMHHTPPKSIGPFVSSSGSEAQPQLSLSSHSSLAHLVNTPYLPVPPTSTPKRSR